MGPHETVLESIPRHCVLDRTAGLRGTFPCGLAMPLPQADAAFVATPVRTVLTRFLPEVTTRALEAWHGNDTATQLTLHVTSTPACVALPTVSCADSPCPQPLYAEPGRSPVGCLPRASPAPGAQVFL